MQGGVLAALALGTFATVTTVALAAGEAPAPRLYGDRPTVAELAALGAAAFADPGLSASGRIACATCHDPAAAFGPGARAASPFADGDPAHAGTRAIPSLRYAQYRARFTEHAIDDEENHGEDAGPSGGLTWDGRADSAREQARLPLFAAGEMGNRDAAALSRRVAAASWSARFRRAFSPPGHDVFDDPERVAGWLALALEVFQQGREFRPFDSRFDRAEAGRASLSPSERRGLALFRDEDKGNCDSCHPSRRTGAGAAPLFTDGSFVALAAPRRAGLPPPAASTPAAWPVASLASGAEIDLGLCRSGRAGPAASVAYCGRFRTPTLRNVALRPSFFHNGSLRSLREVVAFYATRDTDPGRWYGLDAAGQARRYDDLPPDMAGNVDHRVPFAPGPGGRPRLDEGEIDDLVAFLRTLTDADAETADTAAGDTPGGMQAQARVARTRR